MYVKKKGNWSPQTWNLGLHCQQLSLGPWAGHLCFQAVIFLINLSPIKVLTFYFPICIQKFYKRVGERLFHLHTYGKNKKIKNPSCFNSACQLLALSTYLVLNNSIQAELTCLIIYISHSEGELWWIHYGCRMQRINILWILSLTFTISNAYLYYSGRASSNSRMYQNKKKY